MAAASSQRSASSMSHQDRLIARQPQCVHKVKARDGTGQWMYYFIYVPSHRERVFLAALRSGDTVNFEDYGTVLASNYGESPTDETRQLLKERYGFEV